MDNNKRVYGFVDMFDDIPKDAKYLFSKEFILPLAETEEQKTNRIINGNDTDLSNNSMPIYKHYYEVNLEDFEKLTKSEIFNENFISKIERFGKRFNIKIST